VKRLKEKERTVWHDEVRLRLIFWWEEMIRKKLKCGEADDAILLLLAARLLPFCLFAFPAF
jgi:hypothetical protein